MKISNLISFSSDSVVNSGASIPNVYTTKNQHKKTKKIKLGKSGYGNGGIHLSINNSSDGDVDSGDGSAGGDG